VRETIELENVAAGTADSTGVVKAGAVTWVPVEGCRVALASTGAEWQVGGSQDATKLIVYAPSGTVVGDSRRVRVRGEIYAIDGDTFDWQGTTSVAGVVIPLKKGGADAR
jgi:hypothetical protein